MLNLENQVLSIEEED